MTINTSFYYMRLNEWHHLYFGLLMVLGGLILESELMILFGYLIAIDDMISHMRQGIFLEKLRYFNPFHKILVEGEKVKLIRGGQCLEYEMPQFLLHTLFYKYFKIHRVEWIRKVTNFMNKLLGV